MKIKWLKDPMFWIAIFAFFFLLFGVFQVYLLLIELGTKGIAFVSEIKFPKVSINPSYVLTTVGVLLLLWLLYKYWFVSTPTEPSKPKDDSKKKDGSDKAKTEIKSSLSSPLILLLTVLCVWYFWGNDIGVMIRNTKIQTPNKGYTNGLMTCWDKDKKTGKPLSPTTNQIRVLRWDKQKIYIEADYIGMKNGKPSILEWNKKSSLGTWYKPYPEMTGTWWVTEEGSCLGEYSGWFENDVYGGRLSMIIKK